MRKRILTIFSECEGLWTCFPGDTFILGGRGGGGLDLTSSLEAKFGARFSQVHQIKGKIWEVLLPQDAKVGKESQFWGHLGLYLKSTNIS